MTERRTTMAALDWSIEYLKDIKRAMVTLDGKKQDAAWASGGFIVSLAANLLMTCAEVMKDGKGINAKTDLIAIKTKMLEFFDKMLGE